LSYASKFLLCVYNNIHVCHAINNVNKHLRLLLGTQFTGKKNKREQRGWDREVRGDKR
jgi:hypothetical protein